MTHQIGPRALTLTASGGGGGGGGAAAGDWTSNASTVTDFSAVAYADFNDRVGTPGTAIAAHGPAGSGQAYQVNFGTSTGSALVLGDIDDGNDGGIVVRLAVQWPDVEITANPPETRLALEFVDSQTGDGNHYGGGLYSNGDTVLSAALYGSSGTSIVISGGTPIVDGTWMKGSWIDLCLQRVGDEVSVMYGQNGSGRKIKVHSGVSTGDGSFILRGEEGGTFLGVTITRVLTIDAADASLSAWPVLAFD